MFGNAAEHLAPGGRFVVEVEVPSLAGLPAGERGRVFDLSPGHVGVDTHDDPVGQLAGLWQRWQPQAESYVGRALRPSG